MFTVEVLVTLGTAAGPTLTVSVNLRLSPAAIGLGCLAVTVAPEVEKLQPAPAPETNPSPVGSTSVTAIVSLVAALPTLVTTIV